MQQIFRVKGLSVTYTLSCVAMGNSFSPELEEPKERSSRPDVSESVQEPCATPSEVVNPTEILARFIEALIEACRKLHDNTTISDRHWNTIVSKCLKDASVNQPDNVLAALKVMASRVTADAIKAPCLGDVCGVGSVQQPWPACPVSAVSMVPLFRPTGWPRCWQPTSAADPCSSASRRWTNQRNKYVKQLVDWYLVRPPEFVTLHDVGEKYREVVGEDHIAAVAKQAWIAGEHSVRYSCYDLHLRWVPIQNFLNQVDVVDWVLVTKAEAMYLLAMRGWPYSWSDIYLNAFGPVSPIQLRDLESYGRGWEYFLAVS